MTARDHLLSTTAMPMLAALHGVITGDGLTVSAEDAQRAAELLERLK